MPELPSSEIPGAVVVWRRQHRSLPAGPAGAASAWHRQCQPTGPRGADN